MVHLHSMIDNYLTNGRGDDIAQRAGNRRPDEVPIVIVRDDDRQLHRKLLSCAGFVL
jgi:hypothetical protein